MSSERRARTAILGGCVAVVLAACDPPPNRPEACTLPPGDELENVARVDPTIRLDLRYATPNNFTGKRLPGYELPRAMLRPQVAAALGRVQRRLRTDGLGLKIFDAYRPVRATLAMVDWAERSGNAWVLDQGYVARKSGHNLGTTVDLTLVHLSDGRELEMGTPFDTFSPAAHPANATGQVLQNRMLLARAMASEGFAPYDQEWWHFRYPGEFAPLDAPLGCFR